MRFRFTASLPPLPAVGGLLLLLLLLLGSAGEAAAQIVPGWNTKQFTLERIDADRVLLTREVEIEGEKGSPNEGQKFFADNVELNTRTGELTASGNVVFTTEDARISADSVVFNTHTKRGTFTNASGIASLGERGERDRSMFGTMEPDLYFYGEQIEKIDLDKYKITRGAFTTCVQPTPRWEIASGTAIVNLHDYALLNNAVIRVKDVPVFYLPVLYYPIQDDDRATGLLIPTYGNSTFRGQSISNAFFWAISRSQDATFFHDWFTSRGQGAGSEYRYIVSPQSQGDFRLYGLKQSAGTDGAPASTSYQVGANVTQTLPAGLRGRARVDYFSDLTSQQLFNNNLYQQTFSTRSYGGGVSGAWRGLSLSGQFQRNESFYNSNDSFVSGQAPGINASFNGRRIGNLPLYASVNSELSKALWQQRNGDTVADFGIGKFDLVPSIRAPLSTLPFLSANASIGYRVTYFTESLDADGRQIEEPVTRRYADIRGEVVGPVFSRVFNPGNRFADRLKHVIEPAFTLQRVTSIDNLNQIPTTASYEYVVGGVTRFTYGVTNRVLVRSGSGESGDARARGGSATAGAPRDLLTVGINQSYYSNELASPFDQSYGFSSLFRPPSNYSAVALVARAMPAQSLGMDFRMEYDPIATQKKLVGFGLSGVLRSRAVDTSAGWNRQNYQTGNQFTSNNYIQQTTALRFAGNTIGGMVQFNYDIGRSTMLNQRYVANYNAQCCGLVFEYQTFNFPGGFVVNQDRRFNLSFTLAGIGSFSNFFGTFGGGSY